MIATVTDPPFSTGLATFDQTLPNHISPTAAKAYLSCSLMFYFERVACIRKKTPAALHLGKAIHAALQVFALIESRTHATVESSSFPFLGGIGRFVPNPRLGDLTDKLDKLRDEFREATLDFIAGYTPLRENAMVEWREAALHMNGSAERLIATIEQSFPPAGDIAKRFGFETRLFQIAAPLGKGQGS